MTSVSNFRALFYSGLFYSGLFYWRLFYWVLLLSSFLLWLNSSPQLANSSARAFTYKCGSAIKIISRKDIPEANLGDAKLLLLPDGSSVILGSMSDALYVISVSASGNIGKLWQPGISTSWLAAAQHNGDIYLITSSWKEKQLRTYILDLNSRTYELKERLDLARELIIDPTLLKTEDGWFATGTDISGLINNPDPNKENGLYTINLLHSANFSSWSARGTVLSRKGNIEDGRLFFNPAKKTLRFIFEEEVYDHGPSSFREVSSVDAGKTWSAERILLPATADNELAGELEDGSLLFSSDRAASGQSYGGASIYLHNPSTKEEQLLVSEPGYLLLDTLQRPNGDLQLAAIYHYGAADAELRAFNCTK